MLLHRVHYVQRDYLKHNMQAKFRYGIFVYNNHMYSELILYSFICAIKSFQIKNDFPIYALSLLI